MQVTRINNINNINFRENNLTRGVNSENAILMLRDPNAAVKFEKNQEYARMADSVDTNPFVSLGYKLYRTFNQLKVRERSNAENNKFSAIA